jgi:uncharacterized protein (DUF2237 family)
MRGRALLWVGVDLLGGGSIAVHKNVLDVLKNSCLTPPVSGMYALSPIFFGCFQTKAMLLAIHRHLFCFILTSAFLRMTSSRVTI